MSHLVEPGRHWRGGLLISFEYRLRGVRRELLVRSYRTAPNAERALVDVQVTPMPWPVP